MLAHTSQILQTSTIPLIDLETQRDRQHLCREAAVNLELARQEVESEISEIEDRTVSESHPSYKILIRI